MLDGKRCPKSSEVARALPLMLKQSRAKLSAIVGGGEKQKEIDVPRQNRTHLRLGALVYIIVIENKPKSSLHIGQERLVCACVCLFACV